jgi:hypothetical protein
MLPLGRESFARLAGILIVESDHICTFTKIYSKLINLKKIQNFKINKFKVHSLLPVIFLFRWAKWPMFECNNRPDCMF